MRGEEDLCTNPCLMVMILNMVIGSSLKRNDNAYHKLILGLLSRIAWWSTARKSAQNNSILFGHRWFLWFDLDRGSSFSSKTHNTYIVLVPAASSPSQSPKLYAESQDRGWRYKSYVLLQRSTLWCVYSGCLVFFFSSKGHRLKLNRVSFFLPP